MRVHEKYQLDVLYVSGNQPVFTAYVEVMGKTLWGCGNSGNSAKYQASKEVLKYFVRLSKQTHVVRTNSLQDLKSVNKLSSIAEDTINPVHVLEGLKTNVKYNFKELKRSTGQSFFSCYFMVNDECFWGNGNCKKAAKYEAAEEALQYFTSHSEIESTIQSKKNKTTEPDEILKSSTKNRTSTNSEIHKESKVNMNGDSMSILKKLKLNEIYKVEEIPVPESKPMFLSHLKVNEIFFVGCGDSPESSKIKAAEAALKHIDLHSKKSQNIATSTAGKSSAKSSKEIQRITEQDNNPICVLNELKPNLKYDCKSFKLSSGNSTFKAYIKIEGQLFSGGGFSEKNAKIGAALEALKYFAPRSKETKYAAAKQKALKILKKFKDNNYKIGSFLKNN